MARTIRLQAVFAFDHQIERDLVKALREQGWRLNYHQIGMLRPGETGEPPKEMVFTKEGTDQHVMGRAATYAQCILQAQQLARAVDRRCAMIVGVDPGHPDGDVSVWVRPQETA